jgi:branched-chain amino acid transport system permease protein
MLFWQILIDGFAIGSLYALGAMGFALIFGVSGVLNLSHGALMVAAVVAAWAAGNDLNAGPYTGAAVGVAVGFAMSLLTYFIIVRPLQRTVKIREEERKSSS